MLLTIAVGIARLEVIITIPCSLPALLVLVLAYLQTSMTLAPLRLRLRAASFPRPEVAPVMMAVFPVKLKSKIFSHQRTDCSPGFALTFWTLHEPFQREVEN